MSDEIIIKDWPSNKKTIFETFKANHKFINLVNNFGISKSSMVFKIAIVKFLNNYPKMKKSSFSLHFLQSNSIEICQENASEFK